MVEKQLLTMCYLHVGIVLLIENLNIEISLLLNPIRQMVIVSMNLY